MTGCPHNMGSNNNTTVFTKVTGLFEYICMVKLSSSNVKDGGSQLHAYLLACVHAPYIIQGVH